MPELSQGQQLAILQITDIATSSNGALEIIELAAESKSKGFIWVYLSLETKAYRTKNGLAFRDREGISLHIHQDFPFKKPEIYFKHKRFIGTPHVQWGSYICLYQSEETEYDPSDGMFGFFYRVEEWMRAAGKGELDPDDAALHHRRTQTMTQNLLHRMAVSGEIQGFLMPYLGQRDSALPTRPADLVSRDEVFDYPTDFNAMSKDYIDKISKRGEQLTRCLVDTYASDL